MNSYTKFEENRSMNVQDRARKRNADGQTDRQTDRRTDRRTDGHSNVNFFGGYNIIPRTFFKWRGIKKVNFECISIAKHVINLFNDKLIAQCICKRVRKSYTPVVPINNTCSIGYPHDGRADNAAYRHDRRADNAAYRHGLRADSLSRILQPRHFFHMHKSFHFYNAQSGLT